jgi:hypothetical protein
MSALGGSSSGSGTYTLNRAPPAGPSLVERATGYMWTAVDVLTLFARSLIDPGVKTLRDAGRNDTGVRRVATVHAQAVRGSANPAPPAASSGNRLGGSGPSSGSGSGAPAPVRKIAGMKSVASCSPAGG